MARTAAPPRSRAERLGLVATAIVVVAAAVVWGYAVPREVACPLVHPPPPGCTPQARVHAGAVWSTVVAVTYAGVLTVVLTVGRRRPVLARAAVATLALGALVAVGAVLFSTGFVP